MESPPENYATMQRQESRFSVALGYVVGPTIWTSFFVMMAYGLWIRAWYGYVFAAVFATLVVLISGFLYREQRQLNADIERMARELAEGDYDQDE